MPRLSPEACSAAGFMAGGKPPEPPKHLSPRAKRLWRDIVRSKPADWFDPGSLVLLRCYCVFAAICDELEEEIAQAELRDEQVIEELRKNAMVLVTLGTKLRLTVQSSVDRHSRKLDERGVKPNPLLSGTAVVLDAHRRRKPR